MTDGKVRMQVFENLFESLFQHNRGEQSVLLQNEGRLPQVKNSNKIQIQWRVTKDKIFLLKAHATIGFLS